jgi:AmmeMemoRadiSam system protein A
MHLTQRRSPGYEVTEPGLLRATPAFVTLRRRNGELRGCIGRLDSDKPLYRVVQECAISAATRDFRFNPVVSEAELNDLVIEISALSPFWRVNSPEEIEVGKHGLLIHHGLHTGLLLPQVATERHWGRAEFLRAVCMKAGLPGDAWRDAELSVFSAEVFDEKPRP